MYRGVLVEDEELLRQGLMLTTPWAEHGYQVAGSAAAATEGERVILETRPDLVITDIRLPRVLGLDMIESLNAKIACDYIIISGYDDFDYAQRAIGLGVRAYLVKPIGDDELAAALDRAAGFIARRREIADLYGDTLRRLGLPAPLAPAECEPVWYRYVLMLDGDADPFIDEMKRRGVECRRPVYKPLHRYLRLPGYEASEQAWRRAVSVPLYPSLTGAEIETILKGLRLVLPKHCTGREQEKRTLGQASRAC